MYLGFKVFIALLFLFDGNDLANTKWELVKVENNTIAEELILKPNKKITLTFKGESPAFSDACCNDFIASYIINDSLISFPSIGGTKRGCVGGGETCDDVLNLILKSTTHYKIKADTLVLYSSKSAILKYVRIPNKTTQ